MGTVFVNGDKTLTVYVRGDKGQLHYRLKLQDGSYERKGTGTADKENAVRIALERWKEVYSSVQLNHVTFAEAAKSWLGTLPETRARRGNDILCVNNHLIPYFGTTPIATIKPKDIEAYHTFRKQRLSRPYTGNSQHSNNTVIRNIFKHAAKHEWVKEIPNVEFVEVPFKRRGTFTDEQMEFLLRFMQARVDGTAHRQIKWARLLLLNWVKFAIATGMRPGEQAGLQWQHIEIGEHVICRVDGKTGKRVVVARKEAREVLENCKAFGRTGYVFKGYGRERVQDLDTAFWRLLKSLNMKHDSQGQELSLYSLRHYYITQQLLKGVNIHLLARNCGTSTTHIERHYSHVTPLLNADALA
jgi:integrase